MVGDGIYNQPTNTNGYTLMLDLKGSSNKNSWDWENPQGGNARSQRDYHGDHSAGEVCLLPGLEPRPVDIAV